MQLLQTQARCPVCKTALPHRRIEEYKPNFGLIAIIDSLRRDPSSTYRLARERLHFERSRAALLGSGASGDVYRGATLLEGARIEGDSWE